MKLTFVVVGGGGASSYIATIYVHECVTVHVCYKIFSGAVYN